MIKKSDYYNYFKAIITVLVVIGHAARMFSGHGALLIENNYYINIINNLIYGFHMPAFMLMSGCVYYYCINDLGKYKNDLDFVLKKMKRLLFPYIFFGIFYVGPILVIFGFTKYGYFEYLFKGLLLMLESRHLWFLMYLFIYLVASQFLIKKMNIRSIYFVIIFSVIVSFLNIPYLSDLCYYFSFFTLGLYFNDKYNTIFKENNIRKYYIIISVICYIVLVSLNIVKIRFITAIFGIIFMMYIISNKNIFDKIKKAKFYTIILKYSMGLYLFHPMIIYVFDYYFESILNPYMLFILSIIISLTLSLIFTKIVYLCRLNIILGETIKISETKKM